MHALVLFFWLLLVLGFMAPHESLLVAFECARDDDADKKKRTPEFENNKIEVLLQNTLSHVVL